MKQFLAVFIGSPAFLERSGWNALSETEREARTRAGMQGWHQWMAANQARIAFAGGPLGKTRQVSTAGIADARNNLCGYVVVRAESHDEAARMFENHPHFAIFPGEAVEVLECLPTPSP